MKILKSQGLLSAGNNNGFTEKGHDLWFKIAPETTLDIKVVAKNLSEFAEGELGGGKLAFLYLQNQTNLVEVTNLDGHMTVLRADAAITRLPITLGLTVADCIPILISDPKNKIIAIIHGGWRGLVGRLVESTVEKLKTAGSRPEELVVALGPSICGDCYEYGPEAVELFPIEVCKEKGEKYLVDLRKYAKNILVNCGITKIDDVDICVYENYKRFNSYRREGKTGRSLAFIQNLAVK